MPKLNPERHPIQKDSKFKHLQLQGIGENKSGMRMTRTVAFGNKQEARVGNTIATI